MRSWFSTRTVAPIPLVRRFALALCAIAIAGVIGRDWIASGLITRGDDVLRAGNATGALVYYRRAAFFSPANQAAADRYAFAAAMTGDPRLLRSGVALATAHLRANPTSDAVRWDRAVALLRLNQRHEAYGDVRYLALANPGDWRMNDMARVLAMQLGLRDDAARFAPRARPR